MICTGGRGLEPRRVQTFFSFLGVEPNPFWNYYSESIILDIYTAIQLTQYIKEHEGTERDTEGVGCDMS